MKKYTSPTYAVVEIKNSDVIATSPALTSFTTNLNFFYGGGTNGYARSADRGFDYEDIYQGY